MKKVLSFVLVLALVLSSFSMAFAAQATEIESLSDISGDSNEEAIQVVYDLNIVTGNPDGTFQPEKAVTRAEFAAMITRALAIPESALAGYAKTTFKDTAGYAWAVPYLAFCNSKGIMLGDGAGNVMPNKTITVNEAVTMSLRAIGYVSHSSVLVGTWPSNYVTLAQDLQLYDSVAKDSVGVDKANAAQIIFNTLDEKKVAVNTDGATTQDATATLLTAGLNCTETLKTINVGDIGESIICAAKYLGQYGTVYKNSDKEIVAFIPKDCTQITGRFTADGKFTTTDDETEYSFTDTAITNAAVLLNGVSSTTLPTTTALVHATYGGLDKPVYVLNANFTGKNITTIYSVNKWTANSTSSKKVTASDIAEIESDKEFLGLSFAKDDDDNIDYTQFALVGVSSLKDIEVDDVVYVYGNSSDKIRRIEVSNQVVEGTVGTFNNATSKVVTKFAIGADTYKNAADATNGITGTDSITSNEVSSGVKAYLDANGYVYDFTDLTSSDNYAVVEKTSTGMSDEAKLMLADGTEKVFVYKTGDVATLSPNTIIGYGLNSSGEITDANKYYITGANIKLSSKGVISSITRAGVVAVANTSMAAAYINGLSSASANAAIDSDCVVFTYDGTDYGTSTIDKVEINTIIPNASLLYKKNNDDSVDSSKIVAMIVPEAMAKSGDKSFAVINEKNLSANADGDKIWKVVGYKDGAKLETTTDDNSSSLFGVWAAPVYSTSVGVYSASNTSVKLYEIKTDADGVVTSTTTVEDGGNSGKYKVIRTGAMGGNVVANARNSVVIDGINRYALSSKVVIYRIDAADKEYKLYTGDLKNGDSVILYETDDDADGYDVVIFGR